MPPGVSISGERPLRLSGWLRRGRVTPTIRDWVGDVEVIEDDAPGNEAPDDGIAGNELPDDGSPDDTKPEGREPGDRTPGDDDENRPAAP